MATKPFIGIKKIWYGEPIKAAVTADSLKTWIGTAKEVTNVHQDTWSYTQDDPAVDEYINELTGKPYYRDPTNSGTKTIAFTMGVYAYDDKVALQGGELVQEDGTTVGWAAPTTPTLVNKAVVAQTKTGQYIVFTNAGIVGKNNSAEKNIGLGVTAVAMDNETAGVSDEYMFDGNAVDGNA